MFKTSKFYMLFCALFFISTAQAQLTLPITFDDPGVTYTMVDFDGGTTALMANPFSSGINTSPSVLQMIKNVGQVWGGSKLTLSAPLDFTTNNTFKMKVYSPRIGCPVLFKIEGAGGAFQERTATTSVANDWEELSWDFTGSASGVFTDLVFIYDLGVMGDGSSNFTFYQDDIQFVQASGGPAQIDLPITFDAANVNYTVTDFGGTATTLGADPMNASNMVAITEKGVGAQFWAGTTMSTPAGLASVIPFTANNRTMTVRVYSPDAGIPVRLKVEVAGTPTQTCETEAMTTVANAWEVLTFDFNNPVTGTAAFDPTYAFNMASIFFNFGTDGATAGAKTYMWDDVQIGSPTQTGLTLPITFDDPQVAYDRVDFDGGTTAVMANPFSGGINTTANVMQMIKNVGQVWGGSKMTLASPIDFSVNNSFKMKVYSPRVGVPVLFKLEGAGGAFIEKFDTTTVANQWEELTYNFAGAASGVFTDLVFIYDLGVMGDGSSNFTFYQDEIEFYQSLVNPTGLTLPITFDDASVTYTSIDFDGGTTQVMANPFPGGINTTANVQQMIKNAGQVWGGSKMILAAPIDFSTNQIFKMMVYSPRIGCPVLFKVEGAGGAFVEKTTSTTKANEWEELTWDFSGAASGVFTDIVIIYDLGVMGDGSSNFTFYHDEIQLTTGGTVLNQIDLPVSFEDPTVNYTVTDFGGNFTVLGNDPVNAGNTVAITTKGSGAQLWAGTTIGTNLGFASVIPFTASNRKMSINVYSPDAGIPVRLKVEVHGQPTQSCETEAMTTLANTWETLVFDFDNEAAGTAAFDPSFPFDMASVFFNFGTDGATAGDKTYYWDEVVFGGLISIENPLASEVSVYPNPASQALTIKLPVALQGQILTYQVVDITGRQVMSGTYTQPVLNISTLNNGVYAIQWMTKEGVITKRFIKQ